MTKHYFFYFCIFLVFSCSKEGAPGAPNPDETSLLKACFTVSTDTLSLGEELEITSCSVAAVSFFYDFGPAGTSLKEHPKVSFMEEGDYTLRLTVTDAKQHTDTFTKAIYVRSETSKYIYPTLANGYSKVPLELGINPTNGKFYYIESAEDLVGAGGAKINYVELDAEYAPTPFYISDKPFTTKIAFVNFLPNGNKKLNFSRTLPDFYGSGEITLDSLWGVVNTLNSATALQYGFLENGADFLYFGTQKEGDFNHAAIEKRNANGDVYEVSLYSFTAPDALFGALIKTAAGYVAYGGVFTKNSTAPQITAYKPILVFFDNSLGVISSVVYEDSVLDTKISSADDLNSNYHLAQLDNGNLVMYGNGELIVSDAVGNKIESSYYAGTNNPQALISLGDSFIISAEEQLIKFDAQGKQLKVLAYPGKTMPNLIEKNNQLFFVAGYDSVATAVGTGTIPVVKLVYGLLDKELNVIDLNE
jgi:hypothetical protein